MSCSRGKFSSPINSGIELTTPWPAPTPLCRSSPWRLGATESKLDEVSTTDTRKNIAKVHSLQPPPFSLAESADVYGRLHSDASCRHIRQRILEKHKRLEADMADKGVTSRGGISSTLNSTTYAETSKHHTERQVQADTEPPRLTNLHFPVRLDPKVKQRLTSPMRHSTQLTTNQIDCLLEKLYCQPKAQHRQKSSSCAEDVVKRLLADTELQEVSHQEVDDYLLRLKVTSSPCTENRLRPNKFQFRQPSPRRHKKTPRPKASSLQSTARTAAPTLRLSDVGHEEGSFPYSLYA